MIDFEYLDGRLNSIIGIDEVGRGPLCGPVNACSVRASNFKLSDLKNVCQTFLDLGITDSKKLTTKKRKNILELLEIDWKEIVPMKKYQIDLGQKFELSFVIGNVSHELIDEINILNASLLAMKDSCVEVSDGLEAICLIDGNKVPDGMPSYLEAYSIIKGDSKSVFISLASIIAKEYRDNLMIEYAAKYPGYGMEKHAGYPTKLHIESIKTLGVTPIHRKTFRGVKEYV